MSKNKGNQNPTVSGKDIKEVVDRQDYTETVKEPVESKKAKSGDKYLITSQSNNFVQGQTSEVFEGSVEEWLTANPKKYISFLAQL